MLCKSMVAGSAEKLGTGKGEVGFGTDAEGRLDDIQIVVLLLLAGLEILGIDPQSFQLTPSRKTDDRVLFTIKNNEAFGTGIEPNDRYPMSPLIDTYHARKSFIKVLGDPSICRVFIN